MWDYVGIVRTNKRLDWARRNLARLRSEADLLFADGASTYDLVELDNILTTAMLIVECAARRSESRGLHYNTDCPAAPEGSIGADTVLQIEEDHVAA
jgi:L-aspartate oxidase